MKTKHGLFVGFTVLVLTAIFFLAGCSQPTSSNSSKEERGVTGVSINPDSGIIGIGRTLQLQAVVWPEDASNKAVTWTSLNSTVASVDQNGLVTGNMDGEAEIRVTTKDGGHPATARITVSADYVEVSGVSISAGSGTVAIGRTLRLEAVIEPENASNRTVSWLSANDGIATVDQGGMVTGKAVGTVKIMVTTAEGQKTAETTITVTEAVSNAVSIKFDLSGAKAIAALDPSDYTASISNSRALMIGASDSLVKILEDNTLAPLADFSQHSLSQAAFIAHSPVAGKKDFYIYFNEEIRYWEGNEEVNLGKFWHVKEDGSIVNILGNEAGVSKYIYNSSSLDGEWVIFDANGNMFFIVSESSGGGNTNVIYRYNPQAAAAEQLTATRNNLSYGRIVVSPDGALVIAHAVDWNGPAHYLRAIPVANPGGYEDIVYNSGSISPVSSFAISRDSRELYFSGSVTRRVGNLTDTESGFFKVSLENLKTMNPVCVLESVDYGLASDIIREWRVTDWKDDYRTTAGNPDYDKIMDWFYDSAASVNIEFRYNGKTDKEALASLTNARRSDMLWLYDDIKVLSKYWFRKGTDTPVTFEETSVYTSKLVQQYSGGLKYKWQDEFYNGSAVDYGKIMEIIYQAARSRDIEFRYNNKTDAAALASLNDQNMADIFADLLQWPLSRFVQQFCYLKGTNRKVTHIPSTNYRNLSELLYVSTDSAETVFWWAGDYSDAEGEPDTDKIMAYLRDIAFSDNIEFRYNGKTDADALASMTEQDLQNLSIEYPAGYRRVHNSAWVAHCFRKGTDTSVSQYGSANYYSYSYISYSFDSFTKLVVMPNGSLMGLKASNIYSNQNILCQILDAGGKREFYIPEFFINSPVIIKTILAADPYIFYSAKLVSENSGQETAFSKIYRVSSADVVDDMFRYIDRNNDRIELDTFSAGADYLYFSGSQSTSMLSAKIDVNSLKYTEMDFGRRLKLVMSY